AVARGDAARAAAAARAAGDRLAEGTALGEFRDRQRETDALRTEALARVGTVTGQPTRDVNYIIPRFVLDELPLGFAGIFLAAVLAAAMSSIAAELNSLATASVVDFYRRWWRRDGEEAHLLAVSKWATAFWGLFAMVIATYAATLGSLIEVVNRFGSYFYGSILGVFLLAMMPRARAVGAFVGLLAGMTVVGLVSWRVPSIAFLWHNVTGALTVVGVGLAISLVAPGRERAAPR
ncbi:MAG: sodium:solute symporter, partial [Gemmatimonadaceae bacterium]|nr:sodium:solute symporter [Gemmatimonadaceae bacterium]